jgi:hypothetical protein
MVLVPCNFVTYCNPCSCCQVFGEHIDTALTDNSISQSYVDMYYRGKEVEKRSQKLWPTNDIGDVNI